MRLRTKASLTLRGYRTIHTLAPGLLLVTCLEGLFSSALPFLQIFMSALVIDAFSRGGTLRELLSLALLTAALSGVLSLLSSGLKKLKNYFGHRFFRLIEQPLKDKILQMDYSAVEQLDTHLKIEQLRVLRDTMGYGLPRLFFCTEAAVLALSQILYSISLLSGAFTRAHSVEAGGWNFLFSPLAAAVILLLILLNLVFTALSARRTAEGTVKIFHGFERSNRILSYYIPYLFQYSAGKDIKLYQLDRPIGREFSAMDREFVQLMTRFRRLLARNNALVTGINTAVTVVIYSYVALKALFGAYGPGSIVQYAGSLLQLNTGVSSLIEQFTLLSANAEALRLFFEFLDQPNHAYRGTLPVEKRDDNEYEFEFHSVSFRYPGSEEYALRDVSLKFRVGQRLAVVGRNGSGKTTLVKLLCRLYDPTEGEITLNGIDIRKYNYDEYLSLFSVVFQDFNLFSFSLGQNVASSAQHDRERAADCLRRAGLGERLAELPRGLDTCLYRDFEPDGVELSGGEAQKVALARALYREAPFLVLDEPTAALDPEAEAEVYRNFGRIAGDRTALYISHRLSSCRFCDEIAVFEEGRLVERGSHEHLLAEGGTYAALWQAQAQYYTQPTE